jgi:hypothetical protein
LQSLRRARGRLGAPARMRRRELARTRSDPAASRGHVRRGRRTRSRRLTPPSALPNNAPVGARQDPRGGNVPSEPPRQGEDSPRQAGLCLWRAAGDRRIDQPRRGGSAPGSPRCRSHCSSRGPQRQGDFLESPQTQTDPPHRTLSPSRHPQSRNLGAIRKKEMDTF